MNCFTLNYGIIIREIMQKRALELIFEEIIGNYLFFVKIKRTEKFIKYIQHKFQMRPITLGAKIDILTNYWNKF